MGVEPRGLTSNCIQVMSQWSIPTAHFCVAGWQRWFQPLIFGPVRMARVKIVDQSLFEKSTSRIFVIERLLVFDLWIFWMLKVRVAKTCFLESHIHREICNVSAEYDQFRKTPHTAALSRGRLDMVLRCKRFLMCLFRIEWPWSSWEDLKLVKFDCIYVFSMISFVHGISCVHHNDLLHLTNPISW
jgi:hypothetical protein